MAFKCFECAYRFVCADLGKCNDCLIIRECENCQYGHDEGNGTTRCTYGSFDSMTREYKENNIVKVIVPEHCAPWFGTDFDRYGYPF